jgi:hypothetical protein
MTGFGLAPIKREGGIADPDAYTWDCQCQKCTEYRAEWKRLFLQDQELIEQQKKEKNT